MWYYWYISITSIFTSIDFRRLLNHSISYMEQFRSLSTMFPLMAKFIYYWP